MPLKVFSLETFATMDAGRAGEAFAQAVQRLQADLLDRPNLKTARVLRLVVRMKPSANDRGVLAGIDVEWEISEATPKRQSAPYRMRHGRNGPVFSDESPDNPDQLTLGDAVEGVGRKDTKR